MFSLNQLRAFITVADEMHFGRAAIRLNMTQPPLSRQIQALEAHLGTALFDRTRRTVQLTFVGETFLPEARRLLELATIAEENVRRTAQGLSGVINIGFTATFGHFMLPALLRRCAAELGDVRLGLHELITEDQVVALEDGMLDLGMGRPVEADRELSCRPLPSESLVVAIPRSWALTSKLGTSVSEPYSAPVIDLALLHGQNLIGYSNTSRYFHELLATIFGLYKIKPKYVQHVTQIHTILNLVDSGMGAALVPESARRWASGTNTAFLSAAELAPFPIEANLVWRKDSTNPALIRLLGMLEDPSGLRAEMADRFTERPAD